MAESINSFMQEGLEALNEWMHETPSLRPYFLWNSAEVPCIPSGAEIGLLIDVGGRSLDVKLSLNVLFTEFLTADSTLITADSVLYTVDDDTPHPIAGRTLTFRGRVYRILTAMQDVSSAYYKLTLGDKNA